MKKRFNLKFNNDRLEQDFSEDKKILVYRYMWLFEGNDNMCIKVLSGVLREHEQFINALKNDSEVVKCVRVYLHEYNVDLIEFYESIKDNDRNTENIKNNGEVMSNEKI